VILKLMLLPLVLHVVMTFALGWKLLGLRIHSVTSGETKLDDIATDTSAWPPRIRQIGQNFDNQFDTPLFWYGAMAVVAALSLQDWVFVALSWVFLVTRGAHAVVHIGNNTVPLRMRIYVAGFIVLLLMWLWFGFKLIVMP
jgi:hypothetical protein